MPGPWAAKALGLFLGGHVVLTAFENSPDAKVSFGTRGAALARLPQWRFFAPNPGVDDTHLLFRSRAADDQWGAWDEFPLTNQAKWLSLFWNPGTRAPKALFDCAQQIRLMGGQGTSWAATRRSSAYASMEHAIRVEIRRRSHRGDLAQFMIVATRPGDGESSMQPLIVSEPFAVRAGE